MADMRVTKTLVIGLGSTGTRIADAVASRIQWEMTSIKKAPWIEFLCIETNTSEKSSLKAIEDKDFRNLTISGGDFRHMVQNPAAYDATIGLSQWMDLATIQKLPGEEVSSGAGNIRMIGRLALLHEPNYKKIVDAVNERLNNLRQLSEALAKQLRGSLVDGSDPSINFSADGKVRLIITGTLCGGTGSGLASDFGYFLQKLCKEEEKSIAIFTLPSNNMTSTNNEKAERFKKNAYHALVELNHYHLSDRDHEAPIQYSDGTTPNMGKFPYDLTFLEMPKSVGTKGEAELNQAVADRIFLGILVPETDPFGDAVDAAVFGQGQSAMPIGDRDHRAHVFSTFGLSTLEYPAQRVTEACSKRLLSHTLSQWQGNSLSDDDLNLELDNLGLTWNGIKTLLVQSADNGELQSVLNQKQSEISRLLPKDVKKALESLNELRAALSSQSSQVSSEKSFAPGKVAKSLNDAQTQAMLIQMRKLEAASQRILKDYHKGPNVLAILLQGAIARLNEMKTASIAGSSTNQQQVQKQLEVIEIYQRSRLLGLMGLRQEAVKRELPKLQKALNSEIDSRLQMLIHNIFIGNPGSKSSSSSGLLERLLRQLQPINKRILNLRNRTSQYIQTLRTRSDELAKNMPDINGVAIFEAETLEGGTVKTEYEMSLFNSKGDLTIQWHEARDDIARDIIRNWDSLPRAVFYQSGSGIDWLFQDFIHYSNTVPFPFEEAKYLEDAGVGPFRQLSSINVLDRWAQFGNHSSDPESKAIEAARMSDKFLDVNPTLAKAGGRSPIPVRRFLLRPDGPAQYRFDNAVSNIMVDPRRSSSPELFRSVMLEEWYRFPLSSTPSILSDGGTKGLEEAHCTDFPTFWTRNDVAWTGISKTQIQATRFAEEVLVVNILLELVDLKNSAIEIPWTKGMADEGVRRLPLNFKRASRFIASQGVDLNGKLMKGVPNILKARIEEKVKKMGEESDNRNIKLIQVLEQKLNAGVGVVLNDWNKEIAAELIVRFVARDEELFKAYLQIYPPDEAVIGQLHKNIGDRTSRGVLIEQEGLYCPNCGGLIGKSQREAAGNGWRCFVNPEEHHKENNYGQTN